MSYADEAKQALAEFIGATADIVRLSSEFRADLANSLVLEVLQRQGLDVQSLSARGLADAMRAKIQEEYDIDVGDLLDRDSVKSNLRKEALRIVGERLGVGGTQSEIAEALRSRVYDQLITAVEGGDPELLDAVGVGASRIAELQRAAEAEPWPTPIRNFTEKGEKNRERQARYRASHKRVWVAR